QPLRPRPVGAGEAEKEVPIHGHLPCPASAVQHAMTGLSYHSTASHDTASPLAGALSEDYMPSAGAPAATGAASCLARPSPRGTTERPPTGLHPTHRPQAPNHHLTLPRQPRHPPLPFLYNG